MPADPVELSRRPPRNFAVSAVLPPRAEGDVHGSAYPDPAGRDLLPDELRVLFLGADPRGRRNSAGELNLNEERQCLEARLRSGRRKVTLIVEAAAQWSELPTLLLQHQPHILHFSGHGSRDGGLLFHGNDEQVERDVGQADLEAAFAVLGERVRCIVLNACYSEPYARLLSRFVRLVLGTRNKIPDSVAIQFSDAFYAALGAGVDCSVQDAYRLACLRLQDQRADGIMAFFEQGLSHRKEHWIWRSAAELARARLLLSDGSLAKEMGGDCVAHLQGPSRFGDSFFLRALRDLQRQGRLWQRPAHRVDPLVELVLPKPMSHMSQEDYFGNLARDLADALHRHLSVTGAGEARGAPSSKGGASGVFHGVRELLRKEWDQSRSPTWVSLHLGRVDSSSLPLLRELFFATEQIAEHWSGTGLRLLLVSTYPWQLYSSSSLQDHASSRVSFHFVLDPLPPVPAPPGGQCQDVSFEIMQQYWSGPGPLDRCWLEQLRQRVDGHPHLLSLLMKGGAELTRSGELLALPQVLDRRDSLPQGLAGSLRRRADSLRQDPAALAVWRWLARGERLELWQCQEAGLDPLGLGKLYALGLLTWAPIKDQDLEPPRIFGSVGGLCRFWVDKFLAG